MELLITSIIILIGSFGSLIIAYAYDRSGKRYFEAGIQAHRQAERRWKEIEALYDMAVDEREGNTHHFLYEDDPRDLNG